MPVRPLSLHFGSVADPFRILVVCSANICRSPFAAALLRQRLAEKFPDRAGEVDVSSAGVRALVGHAMDPVAAQLLEARGGSGQGFAARQVGADLLRQSDLVLVMTREHRRAVVTLAPAALRKTFTLPELARIARAHATRTDGSHTDGSHTNGSHTDGKGPAAALRELAAAAPALRGPTAPPNPSDDDVADPHRRPLEEYEQAAGRIGDAVDEIVGALGEP